MIKVRHLAVLVLLGLVIFFAATTLLPSGELSSTAEAQGPPRIEGVASVDVGAVEYHAPAADGRVADAAPAAASGEHLPLMIRWSNWRAEYNPAIVYARLQDVDGMLRMDRSVPKMLMVTSYGELEQLMAHVDELHAAGVTAVGLNTENGPGMTPMDEMRSLESADPNVNFVARAARLATENGFSVIWGPIRPMADSVSDDVLRTMMQAGVSGLALQEQKFIETESAQSRIAAVNHTRDRYLRLAQEMGVSDFSFHVQVMHERCPDLNNCVQFVQMLEAIPVDSIAIWSNGPIPSEFVQAIRRQ